MRGFGMGHLAWRQSKATVSIFGSWSRAACFPFAAALFASILAAPVAGQISTPVPVAVSGQQDGEARRREDAGRTALRVASNSRGAGASVSGAPEIATFTLREIAAVVGLLVLAAVAVLVGVGARGDDDGRLGHS